MLEVKLKRLESEMASFEIVLAEWFWQETMVKTNIMHKKCLNNKPDLLAKLVKYWTIENQIKIFINGNYGWFLGIKRINLYSSPFTRKLRIIFTGRSSGSSSFGYLPIRKTNSGFEYRNSERTYSYGDSSRVKRDSLLIQRFFLTETGTVNFTKQRYIFFELMK